MARKITNPLLLLAVGGLLFVGSALAQTSDPAQTTTPNPSTAAGPGVHDPGHPRVNQINGREERQQQRIDKGIQNGQMTPGQVASVERHDAKIQNQENRDMAKHNGHLTKTEQHRINKELDKNSKEIRKDRTQK
ncbi:MAG: hypothetical protein WB952_20645 [Terriglobales bacterium]